MSTKESNWIPEITYEEIDGGISSNIPFIAVPFNEVMPKIIFIFESRETGEFEPGLDGEKLPIVEMDLHQYADMAILKSGLEPEAYDKVREVLGLEPLKAATEQGSKISEAVRQNVLENSKDA